jgi:predicted SprT family Zn-dependent metalloprotease
MVMDTRKLRKLAKESLKNLESIGLTGWKFKWSKTKRGLGYCDFYNKEIRLSKPLAKVNCEARMSDTLRHEIAHALAGPLDEHGKLWHKIARHIGCAATEYADPKVDGLPLVIIKR